MWTIFEAVDKWRGAGKRCLSYGGEENGLCCWSGLLQDWRDTWGSHRSWAFRQSVESGIQCGDVGVVGWWEQGCFLGDGRGSIWIMHDGRLRTVPLMFLCFSVKS